MLPWLHVALQNCVKGVGGLVALVNVVLVISLRIYSGLSQREREVVMDVTLASSNIANCVKEK